MGAGIRDMIPLLLSSGGSRWHESSTSHAEVYVTLYRFVDARGDTSQSVHLGSFPISQYVLLQVQVQGMARLQSRRRMGSSQSHQTASGGPGDPEPVYLVLLASSSFSCLAMSSFLLELLVNQPFTIVAICKGEVE